MKKLLFIGLTIQSFIFTSCYSWYETKVPMDISKTSINLSDFFYEAPAITTLSAPTQVLASQGLYKGRIKLSWSFVENANSYRIERAVMKPDSNGSYQLPEEGDFEVLNKYVYSTNYTDVILSSPKASSPEYTYKYYYRISAENLSKAYESSEFTSIENPKTKACGWLLPSVSNLEAWKGKSEDEIQISWTAVPNAKTYTIYRGTRPDHNEFHGMELLDTVPANKTSYINTIYTQEERGREFYYKVEANLSTDSSAASLAALGYSSVPGAPLAPENIEITNPYAENSEGLSLIWTEGNKNGADNILDAYAIYRTSSLDSSYSLIAKCDSSTLNFTDLSVKPGVMYYYYIQTIITDKNGKTQKSSFTESGPESQNPASGFIVSPPSNLDISDSQFENQILLKWTPALGSDEPYNLSFTYQIYTDTDQNGTFSSLLTSVSPEECQLKNGYYEFNIAKYPFYKIKTVNSTLVSSIFSNTIAPNPDAPEDILVSKTEWVNDSKNANNVYPVKITWSKPKNDEAFAYNIYRSTKPDSSFRKLNEQIIQEQDSKGNFIYIDTNETARAGTIYYYKVVSLNALKQGKKSNDPTNDDNAWGYGMISQEQWFREYNKTIMRSQAKLSLMHKPNDMDKLGEESINGDISGSLRYKAKIAGLGAEITMHYENYCDYYVLNNSSFGPYFNITGNTDTSSNMSANGNMSGTVICKGMYPGKANYNNLQIKGGAAGGGFYVVETYNLNNEILLSENRVDWTIGEEH